MNRICRFIPFSTLSDRVAQVGSLVRYLKPDFLEELSESCRVADARVTRCCGVRALAKPPVPGLSSEHPAVWQQYHQGPQQ